MDKKVVVIVDDDADLLDMLLFSFESEGFGVKGISCGTDAVNYFADASHLKNVGLIILDRMLPDMDGMDILLKIDQDLLKNVPVLFLSVLSSEKDMLSGLRNGAIDYVAKPFSLPLLLEKGLALINRGK